MIDDIQSNNNEDKKNSIIYKVTNEIRQNISRLTDTAISEKSGHKVKIELESIIRNSLEMAIKEYLQSVSDKTISDFKSVLSSVNFSNTIDTNLIDSVVSRIEREMQKTDQTFDLNLGLSILNSLSGLLTGTLGMILKIVLDVISKIPLLDGLLSLFQSRDDELKRRNAEIDAKNKIENMFYNQIIPNVENSLTEILDKIIYNILAQLINTISSEFEQQLKQEKSAKLAILNHQKDENRNIQEQIEALNILASEVTLLKTQYLA